MKPVFLAISVFIAAVQATYPALGEDISWPNMPDPKARVFDDPFRSLDYRQLTDIRQIARLDDRLTANELGDDVLAKLKAQRSDLIGRLARQGIDARSLLSRRWEIAEKRMLAAKSVNPEILSRPVTIRGFAFPGLETPGGQKTAYLVPEIGMCSHYPPPPPNKLVRVLLGNLDGIEGFYLPVEVSGQFSAVDDKSEVFVIDGLRLLDSAVTLRAHEFKLIGNTLRSRALKIQKDGPQVGLNEAPTSIKLQ